MKYVNLLLPVWLPFPDSPKECGSYFITGVGGVITSPGWLDPYPGDIECTSMIRVDHNQKIIFNFLELDLGKSGKYDYFFFYDSLLSL